MSDLGDWVRLDPKAGTPLFDQLRTQIIDGIRDGRLAAGVRLPTVRELAATARWPFTEVIGAHSTGLYRRSTFSMVRRLRVVVADL